MGGEHGANLFCGEPAIFTAMNVSDMIGLVRADCMPKSDLRVTFGMKQSGISIPVTFCWPLFTSPYERSRDDHEL